MTHCRRAHGLAVRPKDGRLYLGLYGLPVLGRSPQQGGRRQVGAIERRRFLPVVAKPVPIYAVPPRRARARTTPRDAGPLT